MLFKSSRRASLKKKPLPDSCLKLLSERLPFWGRMDEKLRAQVSCDMQILLHEKHLEGCGGLTLTDEHRWIIAAQAALMISGGISDYYPHLDSVLVYPQKYVATVEEEYEGGIVSSGHEVRSGESWEGGTVVLSWEEIQQAGTRRGIYTNLVFHEFAHQIDQELSITRRTEAMLINDDDGGYPWIAKFAPHFEAFTDLVECRRPPLLDPYGAEHPAEFFAVATETFFGIPGVLKSKDRSLYSLMEELYQVEMASIL